jgi:hypothetical protein
MPPHIVVIFEDVMGDAKARDKIIDELAGNYIYCFNSSRSWSSLLHECVYSGSK